MAVDVTGALRRGIQRTVARNGLMLVGALFILNVLFVTLPAGILGPTTVATNAFLATVLGLAGSILGTVVLVIAIRVMVGDETERIPESYMTRRIGVATGHLLLGWIAAMIVVGLGFILIIPGIYLLVSLLFWHMVVAVEDRDFIDAFRQSWRMTNGHKWRLFALFLGVSAVALFVEVVAAAVGLFLQRVALQSVVTGLAFALVAVFTTAVVADAYRQVQEEE